MGTASTRSAGTQITKKGAVQGVVLVDPATGNPVDVFLDTDGKYKLMTTGTGGGGGPTSDVNVISSVAITIKDPTSGNLLKINPDGSIDADVILSSLSDSIAIGDPVSGNKMTVNPDGSTNNIMSNTLITKPFDYILPTYPTSNVEVYTYKSGGVSGTIIGVVTVAYTDSTKNVIASVAKT